MYLGLLNYELMIKRFSDFFSRYYGNRKSVRVFKKLNKALLVQISDKAGLKTSGLTKQEVFDNLIQELNIAKKISDFLWWDLFLIVFSLLIGLIPSFFDPTNQDVRDSSKAEGKKTRDLIETLAYKEYGALNEIFIGGFLVYNVNEDGGFNVQPYPTMNYTQVSSVNFEYLEGKWFMNLDLFMPETSGFQNVVVSDSKIRKEIDMSRKFKFYPLNFLKLNDQMTGILILDNDPSHPKFAIGQVSYSWYENNKGRR